MKKLFLLIVGVFIGFSALQAIAGDASSYAAPKPGYYKKTGAKSSALQKARKVLCITGKTDEIFYDQPTGVVYTFLKGHQLGSRRVVRCDYDILRTHHERDDLPETARKLDEQGAEDFLARAKQFYSFNDNQITQAYNWQRQRRADLERQARQQLRETAQLDDGRYIFSHDKRLYAFELQSDGFCCNEVEIDFSGNQIGAGEYPDGYRLYELMEECREGNSNFVSAKKWQEGQAKRKTDLSEPNELLRMIQPVAPNEVLDSLGSDSEPSIGDSVDKGLVSDAKPIAVQARKAQQDQTNKTLLWSGVGGATIGGIAAAYGLTQLVQAVQTSRKAKQLMGSMDANPATLRCLHSLGSSRMAKAWSFGVPGALALAAGIVLAAKA